MAQCHECRFGSVSSVLYLVVTMTYYLPDQKNRITRDERTYLFKGAVRYKYIAFYAS